MNRFFVFAGLSCFLMASCNKRTQVQTNQDSPQRTMRYSDLSSTPYFVSDEFKFKFPYPKEFHVNANSRGDVLVWQDTSLILFAKIVHWSDHYKKRALYLGTTAVFKEFAKSTALTYFQNLPSGEQCKCRIDSATEHENLYHTKYLDVYLTYIQGTKYKGQQYDVCFIELPGKKDVAALMMQTTPDDINETFSGRPFIGLILIAIQRF